MSQPLQSTPQADGFRMPAEYEAHDGCWMLFPERRDVWRNDAKPAQEAYVAVAKTIAHFESVTVGANANVYEIARSMLPDDITVIKMPYNDAWIRDCGATFVINDAGDVRGVDWEFNAWGGELGGLYANWEDDNAVAEKMLNHVGVARYKAPIVVEGGAITVDGNGTLITTRACLLNENRNPNISQTEMDQLLCDYTGVSKIIWLDMEANEETDGHVDGICAFVESGVLTVHWTDDEDNSVEYANCRRVYEQLSQATDAKGRPFTLHKIPAPANRTFKPEWAKTIERVDGTLPREANDIIGGTYINYYIANGGIIMPTYDDPNDSIAHQILSDLYKDRRVVDVPAWEIAYAGGMVHCITQQQPRTPPKTANA